MTILALDQASRTSGYAVFCEDQLIDSGKFTYEDADLAERLVKIRKKVETLIDYFHIENELRDILGTKVKVDNKKVSIYFENVNDLNRILEIMNIEIK